MGYTERKRWLFFGLPFTFTKYIIEDEVLTVRQGLLKTVENDCYMYKIQDVEHSATLIEKLFGLGTVSCYTGDNTHPELYLVHIKNSKVIKQYILEQSEKMRIKRRTVNMLDIGSGDMADVPEGMME